MAHKYNKLANTRILVFGGSAGIGYAVAEGSLASHTAVIITASSDTKLEASTSQLRADFPGAEVSGYVCSLSSLDDLEVNILNVLKQAGKVDHVVYTAGDSHVPTPIAEMTIAHALDAMRIRYFGALMLAKHLPEYLTSKTCACSLTVTTSFAVDRATGGWPAEQSTTMAIKGLMETLAIDLRPIRVNAVGPGVVLTKTFEGYLKPEELEALVERQANGGTLTGEVARPEGIAEAYLWVMRDRGVTGTQVFSDSGAKFVDTGLRGAG